MKRAKLDMLTDFIGGLNVAIDSIGQMVHHRLNPKFMAMRDMLNLIKDDAIKLLKEEN